MIAKSVCRVCQTCRVCKIRCPGGKHKVREQLAWERAALLQELATELEREADRVVI